MVRLGEDSFVEVLSHSSFAAYFIQYDRYFSTRSNEAFGSAIDPLTGIRDTIKYVPVTYTHRSANRHYTVAEIGERLLSGLNVILLGEYGSGKSRCIAEVFNYLGAKWAETFLFPFAINLRAHWGSKRAEEIVRRHIADLGLDDMEASAIRSFRQKNSIFLLDGFDELGMQSWSADDNVLRSIRAKALEGVKDIVNKAGNGILIAGREHYFSSQKEMISTLGLLEADTIVLYANDEFSVEEMGKYFDEASLDVAIPSWVPRRPLICQTIAQLDSDEIDRMFGETSMEAVFWKHFIDVVCRRDSRINTLFDADTIYRVFVELARITRAKAANVGPISPRELQSAFEAVLGTYPVEEAAVMLQRLPSLGRVGAESPDRQFIDIYILDGLRGVDVSQLVDLEETKRASILEEQWGNPLGRLGQLVLQYEMRGKERKFLQLARRAAASSNSTLSADIACSLARSPEEAFDFEGLKISDASIGQLDLTGCVIKNLAIDNATIEEVILPSVEPQNVEISDCLVVRVSGAASVHGLPSWFVPASVDDFDSVRTISLIRHAGLSRQHEILVAIVKKTFFQPGAGRKEEALIRGFGNGQFSSLAPRVLNLLVRENILSKFKGNNGWVYTPQRAHSKRMAAMLDQLRSSTDPLWLTVAEI